MSRKAQPKGTKVTKEFLFDLTEQEFAEKGKAAAALCQEVKDLDVQFEEVKDNWKAKIKAREAKRDDILAVIHAKKEKRSVESVLVKNYDTKEMEYWFEGKVVERRTMTADEVQTELPLAKPKRTRKAKEHKTDPVAAAHANGHDADMAKVIQEETSKRTKLSAVDGARA